MLVISVTCSGRRALRKLEVVAREAELLHNHRFAVLCSNSKMLVDVFVGILDRYRKICLEGLFTHPAPVVRPDMDVHVVDVRT